jgi:hypothetical protein
MKTKKKSMQQAAMVTLKNCGNGVVYPLAHA